MPAANKKAATVEAHETEVREKFHRHRVALAQRASVLGKLLIPLDDGFTIPLRRAPDVAAACREVFAATPGPMLLSLRELQGVIGAHEWRKKGVAVEALSARIYPHYGVFSPVRGEYLKLVASAPLPAAVLRPGACAFDIGTGTGVIAAVLAKRGIANVTATDLDARALACARANIDRLGLSAHVRVEHHHLFPPGRASLVVCNPPWVPAKPSSPIESAVFDPDSRMLRGFLNGLSEHLEVDGEGWLILSDLAEHLGLRSRQTLLEMIASAGLTVDGRHDIRPVHSKVRDTSDPLHAARAQEVTSLWRLRAG
jgi:SAM-dependent methyltransferase